jgi:leucyl/phenylalanyl-tRNA--protein transferase
MKERFPYLDKNTTFRFPDPGSATPEGIVAIGGNLSPGMLLSAYSQGIFPWYSDGDPIIWWSPDPRCVLFTDELHVSKSMKKLMLRGRFDITLDRQFQDVITACKKTPRRGQHGTWITDAMLEAYCILHDLGYAHSVEVWDRSRLAGGMYGVSLGNFFFGESMFSLIPNASKAAIIHLNDIIRKIGFSTIDCQIYSAHLKTLGARMIPRDDFLRLLKEALRSKTHRGHWGRFADF